MSSSNEQVREQVHKYFAALRESYDALASAAKGAASRGTTISERLVREIEAGQREALALGEKLAADPTNPAENYTTVLEATLAAQDRALAFAKDVYSQSEAAGAEGRKALEKLFAANRQISEATVEFSRSWMQDASWAAAWQQGLEAMTSAAEKAAPTATRAKAAATASTN